MSSGSAARHERADTVGARAGGPGVGEGCHQGITADAGVLQRQELAAVDAEGERAVAEVGAVEHAAPARREGGQVMHRAGAGGAAVDVERRDPHLSALRGARRQPPGRHAVERRVGERLHTDVDRPLDLAGALRVRDDGQTAFPCGGEDRGEDLVRRHGAGVGVQSDLDHGGAGIGLRVHRGAGAARFAGMPRGVRDRVHDGIRSPGTSDGVPARRGEEGAGEGHPRKTRREAREFRRVAPEVEDAGDPPGRQRVEIDQVRVDVVVDERGERRSGLTGRASAHRPRGGEHRARAQISDSSRSLASTSALEGSTWCEASG